MAVQLQLVLVAVEDLLSQNTKVLWLDSPTDLKEGAAKWTERKVDKSL